LRSGCRKKLNRPVIDNAIKGLRWFSEEAGGGVADGEVS